MKGETYSLKSNFIDGKPEIEANKVNFEWVKQEVEEDHDPKAKGGKAPPKKNPAEENEEDGNPLKMLLDISKEDANLEFKLHVVFQGEPYEDPNPPEEDENQKAK